VLDREAEASADDLGRLRSPAQVARVDGVDRLSRNLLGKLLGLRPTRLVERRIRVSLIPLLTVPLGLAVACDEKRRHERYASRPLDLGLLDRVCVVTGSTGGIGLATARMLAEEGAQVITSGRSEAPGVGEALHVVGDLSDPEAPAELIRRATELGPIACLVNNVGLAYQTDFDALTDAQWDEMWQLNVMSYIRTIRSVLPEMRARGGSIVNVSSTAGKRPSTSMPNYTVTKAAVLSLSRLVADLYAKDGIRCNAVAPGPTATDAWLAPGGLADQQAERTGKSREDVLEAVASGRPLGRLAEADEIAAVIVFLCSDRASYVTGSAWSADGGTVPIIV
jgi:3-oxoacyl-[acyl-carrier protein] reductase